MCSLYRRFIEEGRLDGSLEYEKFNLQYNGDNFASYTHNVLKLYDEPYYEDSIRAHNKSLRSKTFNQHLEHRIAMYRAYNNVSFTTLTGTAITTVEKLDAAIKKANFHELFHHSEQTIIENLYSKYGITYILDQLSDISNLTSVLGFILDIHTTRALCENCNIALIGLQNSLYGEGYLGVLTDALQSKKHRFETREDGLLWSTRVSCQSSLDWQPTNTFEQIYRLDADQDRFRVLQGTSDDLYLDYVAEKDRYSLDTFNGDFYTSRVIAKPTFESGVLGCRSCL